MDTTTVINLGLLVVTAVGACIAAWQALDARNARTAAEKASEQARDHEIEALRASTSSANSHAAAASALQEANAIALSMAPKSPWVMTRPSPGRIVVLNDSGRQLLDVDAHYFNNNGDIDCLTELPYATMQANESLVFGYGRTMASPAVDTLILTWREAGDVDSRTWAFTIY
jgi:hypothetical protein